MKANIVSLILISLLTGFSFFQPAQAVAPPPDGGYPGFNTAEGQNALFSLTTGIGNAGVGWYSLFSNTGGSYNTAVGAGTLLFNVGSESLAEGNVNTAIGTAALLSNTTGSRNTALGALALSSSGTGDGNTAVGGNALRALTAGSGNTAVGLHALAFSSGGDSNIGIGVLAGDAVTTANRVIAIGASGANVSNSCYIGQIWNQPGGSQAVYVNSVGKLGQLVSSKRFKDEIRPIEQTSEVIYDLQPVSFRYKAEIEPTRPFGFGLIAEDVEKISADLVTHDADGRVNSVRYDAVNAMLLNEFLKEHKKVEQQQTVISQLQAKVAKQEANAARQQKQIEALTAGLQKVSAQLELNKATPQMVLNDQ